MTWLILSLLTALFESAKAIFSKKSLQDVDEYVAAFSLRFFTSLFLLPTLFFVKIPKVENLFWIALFTAGSLNVATTVLYMKAIKSSDLSITVPMVAFTPLFVLLTSPLIVSEFPNAFGISGILLIVAGSYLLNIKEGTQGFFAPFKALLREKGPRLMLVVAFIWSITSNIDKIGVLNSSPVLWAIAVNAFITLCILPLMLYRPTENVGQILMNLRNLLPIGLFACLGFTSQMLAVKLTLVTYVISIKRTSAIMSVIFGYFIFKEKGMTERLLGVTIMVLGVVFVTIFAN